MSQSVHHRSQYELILSNKSKNLRRWSTRHDSWPSTHFICITSMPYYGDMPDYGGPLLLYRRYGTITLDLIAHSHEGHSLFMNISPFRYTASLRAHQHIQLHNASCLIKACACRQQTGMFCSFIWILMKIPC
jgi:hypothetical protein